MIILSTLAGILFWISLALILYTYLGYPTLITLLSYFKPRRTFSSRELPEITLIIVAFNEEIVIEQKINNSLQLDYPPGKLQILVAADGSNDQTTSIVKAYADQGVDLSYEPQRRGKIAAMNRAADQARGEILVFSDANNMYTPQALRHLVAPFSDPRVGGVVGAKKYYQEGTNLEKSESLYWRYESWIKKKETRLGSCTANSGEIFAMRKACYVPPPTSIINDDFYFLVHILQTNRDMVYAPRAHSYEAISSSEQEELQRRARIIAGRFQALTYAPRLLAFKRPGVFFQLVSHKFLRPFVPLGMLGMFLSSLFTTLIPPDSGPALLSLRSPWNWITLSGQILFYLLAAAGKRVKHPGVLKRLLDLPFFIVHSNLSALAGLYRFLFKKQTPVWKMAKRKKISHPFPMEDIS